MNNVASSAVAPPQRPELLTMGSLRDGLHAHLRESGALSTLKTQLRTMVLSEITRGAQNAHNTQSPVARVEGGGGAEGYSKADQKQRGGELIATTQHQSTSWSAQLANRLVESHLRNTKKSYTHSIFVSECSGVEVGAVGARSADGELCAAIDVPLPASASTQASSSSPLDALVSKMLYSRCALMRQSTSVQTDGTSISGAAGGSGNALTDPLMTIEQKLALVDAQHAIKYAHVDHSSKALQEARFRQYKEEIEVELRKEMEFKLLRFRNTELAEVKRQEEERYRLLIAHKGQEMAEVERAAQQRMELERARLEAARHDLEVHRQAVDKRGRDMFALAEEREHSVAHLEKLISDQKGTIQKLHLQLTQLEDLCATRAQEAESWRLREHRRSEDLRRVAAEHMSELRVKDEEISELKYKLKVMGEEYRHHMDRMSLDVRMIYQQQQQSQQHSKPHGGGGGGFADPMSLFPRGDPAATVEASEPMHPYDRVVLEANRYPDYATLLSRGRPAAAGDPTSLDPAALASKEYQVPLHATAAKYLPAQYLQTQRNNADHLAGGGSTAAAEMVGGARQQQQQQHPAYGSPTISVPTATNTAAATLGFDRVEEGSGRIPTPRPIEAQANMKNATTGVRLGVSPPSAAAVANANSKQAAQTTATKGNPSAATNTSTTIATSSRYPPIGDSPATPSAGTGGLFTPPRTGGGGGAATTTTTTAGNTTLFGNNSGHSNNQNLSPIPRTNSGSDHSHASHNNHNNNINTKSATNAHTSKNSGGRGPSGASTSSSSSSVSQPGFSPSSSPRGHAHGGGLPHVQRRQSPVAASPTRSPAPASSSSSSTSPHPKSPKEQKTTPTRPVLDLQKEQQRKNALLLEQKEAAQAKREKEEREQREAEEQRRRRKEAEEKEKEEAERKRRAKAEAEAATVNAKEQLKTLESTTEVSVRRSIASEEAEAIKRLILTELPKTIHSAVSSAEDVAFRAILWSHTSARELLKAKEEGDTGDTMVYGGGNNGVLSRDSDDSDGGVNIFGRRGSSDESEESDW